MDIISKTWDASRGKVGIEKRDAMTNRHDFCKVIHGRLDGAHGLGIQVNRNDWRGEQLLVTGSRKVKIQYDAVVHRQTRELICFVASTVTGCNKRRHR